MRKKVKQENSLLTALRHVSVAQRAIGTVEQTHCRIFGNWIAASNGVISAGHPITEEIQACPHTFTFIDALEETPGTFTITQPDTKTLHVRSGEFNAVVSCVEQTQLPALYPDAPIVPAGAELLTAIQIVGTLIADNADKIVNAAFKLENGTALASNGTVILEAWHGVNIQGRHLVPKALCTALVKLKDKSIYQLGTSGSSITLHFASGAWVKTQTYPSTSEYPDLYKFLNVATMPLPVAPKLFEVAKRLLKFSEDGQMTFDSGIAMIILNGQLVATDRVDGMPNGKFSIKSLLQIQEFMKTIHFNALPGVTLFFGDGVRGAVTNS